MRILAGLLTRFLVLLGLVSVGANVAAESPTIYAQPQSSAQPVGANVTLSIGVLGETPASPLPSVSSGTLQLWLKADSGVETNDVWGLVSDWQDQSGNFNDARQTLINKEPMFESSLWTLNGRPSVRFNGVEDNVNGSFLEGTNDVGVPNAMSSFVVYNAFTTSNFENILWLVGVPGYGNDGADRSDYISGGDMAFTTWGEVYISPYITPTNTYRIKTDRIDANVDNLETTDISSNGTATTFNVAISATAPVAGYSIGGLNVNYPDVGTERTLDGDVAELLIYQGYLSDSDQAAVTTYLQQKYFVAVTDGLTFQWEMNGTNINGATNQTLTLADVQTNETGTYTVIVSNTYGSTTSSNAVITVGLPPTVTAQPLGLELKEGGEADFSVTASGTAPLAYQWYVDSQVIPGATDSTYSIYDVQATDSGFYTVTVSSPYGAAYSSNALLTVEAPPSITVQPQSEAVAVGNNVTLSVGNYGTSPATVASGSLRLWLAADSGVVSDSSGKVSIWNDLSGNTNNAFQSATNQQPTLINGINGLYGRSAVRFNGIQDDVNGSMLQGFGDVGAPNALTSFVVYNAFGVDSENVLYLTGDSGTSAGVDRIAYISGGEMAYSTWGSGYVELSPFTVPTNTYRIMTDRLDTNGDTIEMFDATATTSTNFSQSMGVNGSPASGYFIGGLNPHNGSTGHDRTFYGDIAEVLIFSGYLSDPDRMAVESYLNEKYFHPEAGAGVTYQWLFDGTNIAGATNSTLMLTDVDTNAAGAYSVALSNSLGTTVSSNALITVGYAPSITLEPQNQSVPRGSTVTFTTTVSGSTALSLQWTFNGVNIPNATNASYSITNIATSSSGAYQLFARNVFGVASSSAAELTVFVPTLQVPNASAASGVPLTVPVNLIALGTEADIGFSLSFNPSLLTFTKATLGSNALGGLLVVNTNQLPSRLGLSVYLANAPSPGTNNIANVTFQVAAVANATSTPISFGSLPTPESVTDGHGNRVATVYQFGTISISKVAFEGDVWPVPLSDGLVNTSDWFEEGRIVAGLDIITNTSQMQRADCAPRSAGGDGQLTVEDWVQVGRYAAGLDPLTVVGNPPGPNSVRPPPGKTSSPRTIAMVPMSQAALTNSVSVQLTAQAEENAIGFSVAFDPATAKFLSASLGSGAAGAVMFQNTSEAANGHLGFVVGYSLQSTPTSFSPGIQPVAVLNFGSVSYSNNVALNFADTPVICALSDTNANPLAVNYQNAVLPIGGAAWPALGFTQAAGNVTLSWPISAASGFILESAASVTGPWLPVTTVLTTNNGNVSFTAAPSGTQTFFRLQQHN